jgi:hypothetical protein
MNRIRKYNGKYELLFTPHQRFNTNSWEYMLGNWTDDNLRNYKVIEYDSYNDALAEAMTMVDIDWSKMVSIHVDQMQEFDKIIRSDIDANKFSAEIHPRLMNSTLLKNTMFNRVKIGGERFRLNYNLNDIISFHIVNPWSINCRRIADILLNNIDLRLFKQYNDNGVIHLIGKTGTAGSTYEIVIWPSLIYNWAKWSATNPQVSNTVKDSALKRVLESQQKVDAGTILR